MRKTSVFDKTVGLVGAAGALAALVTIPVSIRACSQSEKAVAIVERQETEERSLLWQGTWLGPSILRLAPTSSRITPLEVDLTFPEGLSESDQLGFVGASGDVDLSVVLTRAKASLQTGVACDSVLRCTFLPYPPGIPVVISSRYAVGGTERVQRALYLIRANPDFIVTAPNVRVDSLNLGGLRFLQLLDPQVPLSVTDSFWLSYSRANDSLRRIMPISGTWWRTDPPGAGVVVRPPRR